MAWFVNIISQNYFWIFFAGKILTIDRHQSCELADLEAAFPPCGAASIVVPGHPGGLGSIAFLGAIWPGRRCSSQTMGQLHLYCWSLQMTSIDRARASGSTKSWPVFSESSAAVTTLALFGFSLFYLIDAWLLWVFQLAWSNYNYHHLKPCSPWDFDPKLLHMATVLLTDDS